MSKFKVGDRVRSIDGLFHGKAGTVTQESIGTRTRVKFDNGTEMHKSTVYLELFEGEPETPRFRVGDRVLTTEGVFKGIEGTVNFVHPSVPGFTGIRYDNGVEVSEVVRSGVELIKTKPRFRVGDRVKSVKDNQRGELGTVVGIEASGLSGNRIAVEFDDSHNSWKLPENLELVEDEPAHHIIRCGICGHEYEVAVEFQSATIQCDCGAALDYFKFDDGRVSITTTTGEASNDDSEADR